jgi:hypothetical protein
MLLGSGPAAPSADRPDHPHIKHRSLDMTMTYARIADRTVADEYHAVSAKVDALYAQPATLPADAEGANMRRLRADLHQRMLGNGYCTRPAELDCHYESICETCVFFQTTIDFAPTLQRQRDHAAERDQHTRVDLFTRLLDQITDEKTA